MKSKVQIDPEEEFVIRCADLLSLMQEWAELNDFSKKIQKKLSEEENREVMLISIAMFVCIAKMLPRKQRNQILEMVEEDLGVPVRDLMHW